jgi:benzoyl-CoA reductase subunit D
MPASIAGRLAKLLRAIRAEDVVFLSGGLAMDAGMVQALKDVLATDKGPPLEVCATEDSIFAGALGAALLGAYRRAQLDRRGIAIPPPGGLHEERAA